MGEERATKQDLLGSASGAAPRASDEDDEEAEEEEKAGIEE